MANFKVTFGALFKKQFAHFPEHDQKLISQFIEHILQKGFAGLEGVNKPSDDVNKKDPLFREKVEFAQKNHLCHYHIGIKQYDKSKPFGKRTSEYVLHYQRFEDEIRIVDYSAHPPFLLPNERYLK